MSRKTTRFMACLSMVLIISMLLTNVALAAHTKPSGGTCNATGRVYIHGGFVESQSSGSHSTAYGTCYKTIQLYRHTQGCSSCGYVYTSLGSVTLGCRTAHTYCPTDYTVQCI